MNRRAFTLIELLIVVAIIAILAAIAVPNFLEAQVRAKVARQLSNMRTVATALELYAVDNNVIPLCTENTNASRNAYGTNPAGGSWEPSERWKFYPGGADTAAGLTTPIAYISSAAPMEDIFRKGHVFPSNLAYQIMYLPTNYYISTAAQHRRYGAYVMRSAGPDTYYQNHINQNGDYGTGGPGGWSLASYDATNGSISGGDVYRSQKRPDEDHT